MKIYKLYLNDKSSNLSTERNFELLSRARARYNTV